MPAKWLETAKRDGCGALPPEAERELMEAARTEKKRSMREIDRAYERTSTMFPHLFKDF